MDRSGWGRRDRGRKGAMLQDSTGILQLFPPLEVVSDGHYSSNWKSCFLVYRNTLQTPLSKSITAKYVLKLWVISFSTTLKRGKSKGGLTVHIAYVGEKWVGL